MILSQDLIPGYLMMELLTVGPLSSSLLTIEVEAKASGGFGLEVISEGKTRRDGWIVLDGREEESGGSMKWRSGIGKRGLVAPGCGRWRHGRKTSGWFGEKLWGEGSMIMARGYV